MHPLNEFDSFEKKVLTILIVIVILAIILWVDSFAQNPISTSSWNWSEWEIIQPTRCTLTSGPGGGTGQRYRVAWWDDSTATWLPETKGTLLVGKVARAQIAPTWSYTSIIPRGFFNGDTNFVYTSPVYEGWISPQVAVNDTVAIFISPPKGAAFRIGGETVSLQGSAFMLRKLINQQGD